MARGHFARLYASYASCTQVYAEMYVRPNVRVHITRDHWCATQQSIFVEQKFLELLTVSYASFGVIDY